MRRKAVGRPPPPVRPVPPPPPVRHFPPAVRPPPPVIRRPPPVRPPPPIRHAQIEAVMPKLRHAEYYTEPRIQELAAKERAEPGFCRHVKDFVVGRYGYGSIKFLGATDVQRLDLESLVQFSNGGVIVYRNDSKKPPVGQGLNKPAEVTLHNIKCFDKKTGSQCTQGPEIDKFKDMLKRKPADQGARFVSYYPIKGEWKFRVNHFSHHEYKLGLQ